MKRGWTRLFVIGAFIVAMIGAFLWKVIDLFRPQKTAEGKAAGVRESLAEVSPIHPIRASAYVRASGIPVTLRAAPRCFARSPSGAIWVGGGSELLRLSSNGTELSRVSLPVDITALASDADGTLYAAEGNRIEVRDSSGALIRQFADLDEGALVVSIAADPLSSDIFLADAGNKEILHYTKEGRRLAAIGSRNEAAGIPGFVVPSPYFSIAVSSDRRLYAANPGRHGIEIYGYDGSLVGSFYNPSMGISGFAGCCNPACIVLLEGGNILTVEKGIKRIKIVSPSGELLEVIADEESLGERFLGDGALVGADGRLLVLDRLSREILVFQGKPT